MSVDLASLVLGVDSSQVEKGIASLDRLAAAGARAEQATKKQGAATVSESEKAQVALGKQIIAIERNTSAAARKAAATETAAIREQEALLKTQEALGNQILAIERNTQAMIRKALATEQAAAREQAAIERAAAREEAAIRKTQEALGDQILAIERNTRAAEAHTGQVINLSSALRIMAAAFIAVQAVSFLTSGLDNYTRLTAQLKNATASTEDYLKAITNVKDISRVAQSDLAATATVYARLSNSLKDLGGTQEQVKGIVQTLTFALKANGATTEETTSTLLQMSQAFGKGKLDGDEFRTAMEAAPNVMRALATSMGVPFGALKDLAKQGEITREVMIKAFTDPAIIQGFQAQAESMQTIGGAWQVLENNIQSAVGQFNEATGASKLVAGAIKLIADNLEIVAAVLIPVGAGLLAMATTATITALTAISSAFWIPAGIIAGLTLAVTWAVKWANSMNGAATATENARKSLNQGNLDKANGAPVDSKGVAQLRELERLEKLQKVYGAAGKTGIFSTGAGIDAKIRELKEQLGLASYQTPKATYDAKVYAPDFKKGIPESNGYDATVNNQKELDASAKARAAENKRAATEAHRQAIKDVQDQVQTEFEETEALNAAKAKGDKELATQRLKDLQDEVQTEFEDAEAIKEYQYKLYEERTRAEKKLRDEANAEIERSATRISDNIKGTLANAILNGGKLGASQLKAFFKTVVLEPIINAALNPLTKSIGTSIATLFSGSASASTGASGGGVASIASSLFQGAGAQISALNATVQSFSGMVSNMGLDKLGAAIFQNSGAIANALPYAGAVVSLLSGDLKGAAISGIATTIGSFTPLGPIGGAIVGQLLGSVFGGREKGKGDRSQNTYVAGAFSSGNTFSGDKGGSLGAGSSLRQLSDVFASSVGSYLNAFGIGSTITTDASFGSKKGNSHSQFGGTINGAGFWTSTEGDFAAGVNAALSEGIVKALRASSLSEGLKSLFDGLTDRTQVSDMMAATLSLNSAQKQLASQFGITVDQAAKVAKVTGLAGADLVTFVNKMASAAGTTRTIGDQLFDAQTAFQLALGSSLIPTLEGFDSILKSIDKSSATGIAKFAGLFSIRDTFIAFTQQIDSLKGGVKGALYGIVSDAEKQQMAQADLSKAFGALNLAVPTSVEQLIAMGKNIDYSTKAGLDLAAVFPNLVEAFNKTNEAAAALSATVSADGFSSLFEFNRYKAISSNYGQQFSSDYQFNMKNGNVQVDSLGSPTVNGAKVDLVAELRDLGAALVSIAVSTNQTSKFLQRWNGDGMPEVRTLT